MTYHPARQVFRWPASLYTHIAREGSFHKRDVPHTCLVVCVICLVRASLRVPRLGISHICHEACHVCHIRDTPHTWPIVGYFIRVTYLTRGSFLVI